MRSLYPTSPPAEAALYCTPKRKSWLEPRKLSARWETFPVTVVRLGPRSYQ